MMMDTEFADALAADRDFFDWALAGDERFFVTLDADGAALRPATPERGYDPELRSAS